MSATKTAVATSPTPTTVKAAVPSGTPQATEKAPRRTRRGLKRLPFEVPKKMPLPVKALWQGASAEQQATAHQTATAILRTWLGKSSREVESKELGLSAVRFWQLSQQAVCGLVVGCLRQPRFRGRPPAGGYGPEAEGVGALRKRIAELERELDGSRRLIDVMKDLPGNRDRALGAEDTMAHGGARASKRGGRAAPAADDGGARVDRKEGADGP